MARNVWMARRIKVGAKVQIIPSSFPLMGLDDSARGILTVDDYGPEWMGRYSVEAVDSEGNRYGLLETELIVISE